MRYFFSILFLTVFACAPISVRSESLVIVSPHWEGLRYEFEAGFQSWRESKGMSPIQISWRDVGGTSEIVRYIQSEFEARRKQAKQHIGNDQGIGIDLVFGGGIDPYLTFKKQHLLEAINVDDSVLSRVAQEVNGMPLYDKEHFWFAPTMSVFGIFCNNKVLSKLGIKSPQYWEDLIKPEFATWLVAADPRRSGSSHMFYEIILQSYGWDNGWTLINLLAKNYRSFLGNSAQAILEVVNGDVACSFAIDSQANSQIAMSESETFSFQVPRENSLFNGDGIAVLRGAANKNAAKSFVEFSLSREGQQILFLPIGAKNGPIKYELNRLPVLPELFTHESLSILSPFNAGASSRFNFDSQLGSARWEILNDLLEVFVVEPKDQKYSEIDRCGNLIPTQNEINSIIENSTWGNQIERNRTISQWKNKTAICIQSSLVYVSIPFFALIGFIFLILIYKYFFNRD